MAYNLYKLVKFDTALSKSAFEINMALSTKEQQQYSRHLLLPEVGFQGQEKLKNAKVLVIGVGGLGCPVLQYLTAAGVGTIGIIDDDIVEKSNLQRQVLFSYEDIGKPKVGIAVQRLKQLNPFVSFVSFEERLSNDNAVDLFRQFDIIVDGTDNFPSRYLVNDAAIISNRPVVFGSI
ncbi:MAG: HesA/MoeB/ThiF family protein, partial [Flavobacteriales bacterium]